MEYSFFITSAGRRLLAKLLAGETLEITRIMVGKGRVESNEQILSLTDLIEPVAQASCTEPVVSSEEESVSFIIEYRNDMNNGLEEGFWLSEFSVHAMDPDDGEVMIYYATLGDYPQYVTRYREGAIDTRRYPVVITVSSDVNVTLAFPPSAYMTAEDVAAAISRAASLGGAYRIDSLTIPADGWERLDEPMGNYPYCLTLPIEGCNAIHMPSVALSPISLVLAEKCSLCPTAETFDGGIRFWAREVPEGEMTGNYSLIVHGNYSNIDNDNHTYNLPIASSNTLGGVKIPSDSGLKVDDAGNLSINFASDEEVSDAIDNALGEGASDSGSTEDEPSGDSSSTADSNIATDEEVEDMITDVFGR